MSFLIINMKIFFFHQWDISVPYKPSAFILRKSEVGAESLGQNICVLYVLFADLQRRRLLIKCASVIKQERPIIFWCDTKRRYNENKLITCLWPRKQTWDLNLGFPSLRNMRESSCGLKSPVYVILFLQLEQMMTVTAKHQNLSLLQ